jgi:hypothetical protein
MQAPALRERPEHLPDVLMANLFESQVTEALRHRLENHPIYAEVQDLHRLRVFMEHHAYAVWDFMSLLKAVQGHTAPTSVPWMPTPHSPVVRHFVNAMVLAEESDEGLPDARGQPTAVAHFDLYRQAMNEIGADTEVLMRFLAHVRTQGIESALAEAAMPRSARRFMVTTFGFIGTGKAHIVAAALAVGREKVIPGMFRVLLKEFGVAEQEAPAFHHYLKRHIHLDDHTHGPMAVRLLEELGAGDSQKVVESEQAAEKALKARLRFWDEVRDALRASAAVTAAAPQPNSGVLLA